MEQSKAEILGVNVTFNMENFELRKTKTFVDLPDQASEIDDLINL